MRGTLGLLYPRPITRDRRREAARGRSDKQYSGFITVNRGAGWGPLTGVPMSPVDFKKCQCGVSLSLVYAHVMC